MAETAELFVDISLKGNFGTGIAKAQKATRNFANETKKASSQVGKMQGAVSGLGTKLRSITKNPELKKSVLTGVGLGGGVVGFQLVTSAIQGTISVMGDSIGLASDLAESQSKVDEVFEDSADEIHDWSQTLIREFGLTERAAEEAAGTFGNFTQALGVSRDESVEMSKRLVELGGDLAAFNNVSVDDVLVSLRAGIAGEAEPMRRLGADVSAARVESILLAKGIQKLNGRFTEGQKVLGRYEAIMQDTRTAQGNFALTSGDLAGQQKILGAQLETLQTKLGQALLPAFQKVVEYVNDDVIVAFDKLGDGITELITRVEEFRDVIKEVTGRDILADLQDLAEVSLGDVFGGPDNARAAREFTTNLERADRDLASFTSTVDGVTPIVRDVAGAVEDVAEATGEMADEAGGAETATRKLGNATLLMAQATGIAVRGFRNEKDELRALIRRANRLGKTRDNTGKRLQALTEQAARLQERQAVAAEKGNARQVAAIQKAINKNNEMQAELRATQNLLKAVTAKNYIIDLIVPNLPFGTTTPKKKAAGGPVKRGDITLVGEGGPELRVERSSGHIIDAGRTRGILAGAMRPAPPVVNVTNTISAYDVQGETSRVLATNRQVTP